MSAPEALPMHYVRRGRPQTPNRQAVEAELRKTTRDHALSAEQIAARIRIALDEVRRHVTNICARGWAHRVTRTTFAWGPDPRITSNAASPARRDDSHYDGRELRPYTGRPGAMDAFALPSLQDGQRVPRRPPAIMAAAGGMRMTGARAIPAETVRKERR